MMVMEFGTDLGTRSPSDNWPTLDPIATYTHDASAQRIWWVWRDSYKYIRNANLSIASIENMDASLFKHAGKERLLAEARFIRGFLYFHLTNFFGDLPVIRTCRGFEFTVASFTHTRQPDQKRDRTGRYAICRRPFT